MFIRTLTRTMALACLLAASTLTGGGGHAAAVELQPTTTIYLPNIVKMLGGPDGWNTPFIVQNVGSGSTDLTFEFYRFSDGALVKTRNVAALAQGTSVFHSPNHDADLEPNGQYSVVIKSFGSVVVAVVNEHQSEAIPQQQEALSYDGLMSGSTRVYLPRVAALFEGWYCTVIMQNLGAAAASVTAQFKSFDGAQSPQLTRLIPPRGSKFIDPRFEASLVAGTEYGVSLISNEPIGVVVNCHNDQAPIRSPRAYSYNGIVAPNDTEVFGPYTAHNVLGRTSRVIVQNAGVKAAQPVLYLMNLGTSTTSEPIYGPAQLQPGAVWTYNVGVGPFFGEKSVVVTGGQFALMVETISSSTAMAYTGSGEAATRLYLPNITRTLGGPTGWTTPIVVQSLNAHVATLRWYRFQDGALVHTQELVFGLDLRWSSFKIDPRSIPQLQDDTQYAVVIEASMGGVAAVVLELNDRGGDSAMAYEAMTLAPAAPFGTTGCTPAIVVSGYTTRCRFYGLPAGAGPVTASFSSPGGQPVAGTPSDEPVATDGSWSTTLTTTAQGIRTMTVTAGGVSRTVSFTVTAPTFSVQNTTSTNGSLAARTKPGAVCVTWILFADGQYSNAAALDQARTADAAGNVAWSYPPDAKAGSASHTVRCTVGGETHLATTNFNL